MSNKTILIKIASRERPEQLLMTVSDLVDMAENPRMNHYLFSFDSDDASYVNKEFKDKLLKIVQFNYTIVFSESKSKVDAINRDVQHTIDLNVNGDIEWDILVNCSDDQRPIVKGWDEIIRNTMPDHLDASLWFTDGQNRINTMEIIGRKYYDRFGYIYHPDFKSFFCDNLATDMALFQGKCIRSNQKLFDHLHPAWCKPNSFPMDDLYRRNQKFWNEDEFTYKRIVREGLDKLIIKG